MLSLRYFPANAAWAFTFGESMVRLEDEDMFFAQRARAIHAADRKGLQVDRSGIVSVARGESEDERMENPMYPDFTDEELAALAIMNGYKAFARDKHFQEAGLGPFTRDNEIIRSLAAKRMVSIRGSAIVPDKERTLEVMKQHYAPAKYARHFSIWQFKDPAKVAEPARSGDVDEIITAEEVATLRVGSLLWSDGRSWVVVLGGIAPVSMLSNSPGEWQPEGESAHSIGESFTVIARGNSSLPTGRTAQRKVSDWWDKRQTTRRGNPARTSAPVAGVIQAVSMALLAGAILHAGPEGKVTAGNGRVEDWRAVSTGETIAQDQDPTDLATLLVAMVGADAASAAVEQWREKQRGSVQPSEDRQENPVSRLRCPACRIFLHELILHPGVNFCRVCGEDETKPAYYVMAGGELAPAYSCEEAEAMLGRQGTDAGKRRFHDPPADIAFALRDEMTKGRITEREAGELEKRLAARGEEPRQPNPAPVRRQNPAHTLQEMIEQGVRIVYYECPYPLNGGDGTNLEMRLLNGQGQVAWIVALREKSAGPFRIQNVKADHGWGPVAYDLMMERVTELGGSLQHDPRKVTPEARAVWAYYSLNRPDVVKLPAKSRATFEGARFSYQKAPATMLTALRHAGRVEAHVIERT